MTILHIDSSITGENSVSRVLTRRIVEQLSAGREHASIIHRDLVADPLDHLTLGAFADSSVLDEFLAADALVIGAPMYNFTLPSQLKAWLDRILVAGRTFRYREDGSVEGLAAGKRVIVALSRGGFYRGDSPAAGLEHLETYLAGAFGFIGITPEFVAADGIAIGPEQRQQSVANALGEVERLAA
ncbi:FMN-dependent NADH-azoreductase [Sphingomonas arenae]|uniref:FMN-dependent NADH-azoreductase n=1 Tax=Sphingomonas arenae TaxID=2812555 RepID=UPI0019684344|nr:NAD(P)H-dependent oxidoreductase [Sphingomonas arenae]